jgi:hypothetical protein
MTTHERKLREALADFDMQIKRARTRMSLAINEGMDDITRLSGAIGSINVELRRIEARKIRKEGIDDAL